MKQWLIKVVALVTPLLVLFWSPPTPDKYICHCCCMFMRQFATFVCQLFGAGQEVLSESFLLLGMCMMRTERVKPKQRAERH